MLRSADTWKKPVWREKQITWVIPHCCCMLANSPLRRSASCRSLRAIQAGFFPLKGRVQCNVSKASLSSDQSFQDDYIVKYIHYHCFTCDLFRFHPAFKQWPQYTRPPLASHVQPEAGWPGSKCKMLGRARAGGEKNWQTTTNPSGATWFEKSFSQSQQIQPLGLTCLSTRRHPLSLALRPLVEAPQTEVVAPDSQWGLFKIHWPRMFGGIYPWCTVGNGPQLLYG